MDKDYYKQIFAKNLRHYMELNGKTQVDLIDDLGFNKSAVSTWCNATRLPRMDKVDALAKYFNIKRSELIEEHSFQKNETDSSALADHEYELLTSYRQLNKEGQKKVRVYSDDLVESGKYDKKECESDHNKDAQKRRMV